MSIQSFPLSSLSLSPLNQRQVRDPSRVQDLVASIRSAGVVQNLCVTIEGGKKKQTIGVVAGGRRLLALQVLAESGAIPADFPVSCEVVDTDKAIEISLAENTQREQMNPIEEVRSFASLRSTGLPVEDIAARFGVTPLVVQRRLRLACISPTLLTEAEAGKITLEQLMALTVVEDHARQEECWNNASHWDRQPAQLRNRLLGGLLRADQDPRMKAIGTDAYQQAGGKLTHDLFDDHPGYIDNVSLLDRLVSEALTAAAEKIKAEGWTPHIMEGAYSQWQAGNRSGLYEMRHSTRAMTKAEEKERGKREKRAETAQSALEALHAELEASEEDTDESSERIETAEKEVEEADAALEMFDESLRCYSEEQKANAYALVFLASHGQIMTMTGYTNTRPGAASRDGEGDDLDGDDADSSGGFSGKREVSFHSAKLANVLSAERTLALQASLVLDPSLALLASLERMAESVILRGYSYDYNVKLSATSSTHSCGEVLPDADNTEALHIVKNAVDQWAQRCEQFKGEGESVTTFDWLLSLSPEDRLALHAVCVAVTVDVRRMQDHHAKATPMTKHSGLTMNRWWKPSAKRYFLHLSKSQILTVLTEAGFSTEGLDKLKKDALAVRAEELMAGSDWLPMPLRA